jgi:MFS family permease
MKPTSTSQSHTGTDAAGGAASRSASIWPVIRNPHFLKLWVAQILSQTAQQIINLALIVQVAGITESSLPETGIIISFTVPAILFAAIAGVLVERHSKRTMLVVTNLARGMLVLGYVLTDVRWGPGAVLPVFFVVTFLFASVSQFFNPAELAMIPLLVERGQLLAANSLFNLSFTACQLGGFVVLGPVLLATVVHDNYAVLYLILFGLFVVCAGLTYLLPGDRPHAATLHERGVQGRVSRAASDASDIARTGFRAAWDELVEGWHFVRREPIIFSVIMYWSIAITVFMMLGAIGPKFLEKVLGIPPSNLYTILLPGGVGLVLGVILVGRLSTPANRLAMINWSLFAAGWVLILFALMEPLTRLLFRVVAGTGPPVLLMVLLLGLMAFILGLLNSFIGVPAQTAMQERSPENIRARVFSFFFTAQNVILIVPVLLAGVLAGTLGYVQTVILIGVVITVIASVGLYRNRQLQLPFLRARPGHGRLAAEEAEVVLAAPVPGNRPPASFTHSGRSGTEED